MLKSLRERLKIDFDDPKLIFLTWKESFRFLISTRCSAYFDSLSAEKHDIRHSKFRNFGLVAVLEVYSLALKHHFKVQNVAVIDLESFFALKSLRERLKRDFYDSKPFFSTCKESVRYLISTRCSAHFGS